jgi:hypothetical protein
MAWMLISGRYEQVTAGAKIEARLEGLPVVMAAALTSFGYEEPEHKILG